MVDKRPLALFDEEPPQRKYARVFNCRKSDLVDRQIGDRRSMNSAERSLRGPLLYLPGGYLLTGLRVERGRTLIGCATDRKDFYHQSRVSRARSKTNCLPFVFHREDFAGSIALAELDALKKPQSIDKYFGKQTSVLLSP